MNYILFDDFSWNRLLPLTFTRPVGEIRLGILTIKEKWDFYLQKSCSYLTQDYLSDKFPAKINRTNIIINGSVLPNKELVEQINKLNINQALLYKGDLIAVHLTEEKVQHFRNIELSEFDIAYLSNHNITKINHSWEIFKFNGWATEEDYALLTHNRQSEPISPTNQTLGENKIFLEQGKNL